MQENVTLEELRILARQARLTLSDAELQRLLPAVTRARTQTAALRALVSDSVEPAGVFAALRDKGQS